MGVLHREPPDWEKLQHPEAGSENTDAALMGAKELILYLSQGYNRWVEDSMFRHEVIATDFKSSLRLKYNRFPTIY